ncbi:hypothetical protein C1N89_29345 (plasmid) [Priestia aryabhattai]
MYHDMLYMLYTSDAYYSGRCQLIVERTVNRAWFFKILFIDNMDYFSNHVSIKKFFFFSPFFIN